MKTILPKEVLEEYDRVAKRVLLGMQKEIKESGLSDEEGLLILTIVNNAVAKMLRGLNKKA